MFRPPSRATERTGLTWMRIEKIRNGKSFPESETGFVPMMCQQCGHHTPCVSVCPQNAVELDPTNGIVAQIPVRCLGCRYCMTACPYHARYFNWWDLNGPTEWNRRSILMYPFGCAVWLKSATSATADFRRRRLKRRLREIRRLILPITCLRALRRALKGHRLWRPCG